MWTHLESSLSRDESSHQRGAVRARLAQEPSVPCDVSDLRLAEARTNSSRKKRGNKEKYRSQGRFKFTDGTSGYGFQ
jgi:hypothetical protein